MSSQIKICDAYSYMYDIVRCVRDHKRIPIDEFNLMGGRRSAKSTSVFLLYPLLCQYANPKDFGWVSVRNEVQSSLDLLDDITQAYDGYEVNYGVKRAEQKIILNGNTMRVIGVNNNRKGQKARKSGFPRFSNVRYVFIFFEERFEFNEDDVRAVIEAVRSINTISGLETQYVVINACNPWAKSSPYVTYCGKYQTWNVNILKTTGNQIGVYDIPLGEGKVKRALFHYTNWRVAKEFLSESEINQILDTWNFDKKRAATSDWGLPGYEDGAIYTHLLTNLHKAIYQEHTWLIAGGDYGWGRDSNSGKTVFHFGGASLESGIDIYNEYVTDNHEYVKEPNRVAEEVVLFYLQAMREYCNRIGWSSPFNISVRVDNMAMGFIQLLNNYAQKYKLNWLKFVRCKKYPTQDRIELTLALMGRQMLRLGDNVRLLKDEMELAQYSTETETQKRVKKDDHALNSFEYAIEPIMYKLARVVNLDKLAARGEKIW